MSLSIALLRRRRFGSMVIMPGGDLFAAGILQGAGVLEVTTILGVP